MASFGAFDNQVATSAAKSGIVKGNVECQFAVQGWIDEITKGVTDTHITDDNNPITFMSGLKYNTPEFNAL